jgi:uncharacterized membrane protein YdcZ (DUF606 family)
MVLITGQASALVTGLKTRSTVHTVGVCGAVTVAQNLLVAPGLGSTCVFFSPALKSGKPSSYGLIAW